MSESQTDMEAYLADAEIHNYVFRTTKDLWDAYNETLLKSQAYDDMFQHALIDHIIEHHPDGEDAVPTPWLHWHDGAYDRSPRQQLTDPEGVHD